MRKLFFLCVILLTAGCSLLDRQGPPLIRTVRTSRGEKPALGRGKNLSLTISAHDPDNDELDFRWTAVPISGAARSGGKFLNPRTAGIPPQDTLIGVFQDTISIIYQAPTAPDTYLLRLRLSDGTNTLTDSLLVEVTQRPPTASAGQDRQVAYADTGTVTLDGGGSKDPDDDDLTYVWTQISGPNRALSGNGAHPFFHPSAAGDYRFRLRVFDGIDSSNVVTVIIRVNDRGG